MTQRSNPSEGAQFVRIAYDALRAGERLDNVPEAMVRIIERDVWQDRICQVTKERVQYDDFVEFVEDDPPEGLGSNLDQLKSICSEHAEAMRLIREVSTGNDGNPTGNNQHGGTDDNMNSSADDASGDSRSAGTSLDYTLERLHREAPELYEAVRNDEMSAHAAAVEAGFRQERTTILLSVESAANTIEKKFDGRLAALIGELSGRLDDPDALAEALAGSVDDAKALIDRLRTHVSRDAPWEDMGDYRSPEATARAPTTPDEID